MLTVQEQAARMTSSAVERLFDAARYIPEDKRLWTPAGTSRSTQAVVAECAVAPTFQTMLIQDAENENLISGQRAMQGRIQELSSKTLEEAYAVARQNYATLLEVIRAFPGERLEATRHLAMFGAMNLTYADLLFIPYWNLTYHLGQINYIQTALGDMEMRL